jgi:tetratricopeptide (TPR) repeat protein
MGSKIQIVSKNGSGLESRLSIDADIYDVQTEGLGIDRHRIVTKVYHKGEIVHVVTSDYSHILKLKDSRTKIADLMENQHKLVSNSFIQERSGPEQSKSSFAGEVTQHIKRNDHRAALDIVRHALDIFPSDPFFWSYYGFLLSSAEKKNREGIRICEEAIVLLRKGRPDDLDFFYPLFYLNLGRCNLNAGLKKAALTAFREGLKFNPRDRDLLSEIKRFGARKGPVFPFLERANPINRFLGKIRHRLQK